MIITSCKTHGERAGGKVEAQNKDAELHISRRLFMQSNEIKSYEVGFKATNGRTYTVEISPEEWEDMKRGFDTPISSGNWFRRTEE